MAMHWLKGLFVFGISAATVGCASIGSPLPSGHVSLAPGALEVAQNALAEQRYGQARTWFQKVLEADPKNERAKLGLAEAWLGDGVRENALALFESLTDSPTVGAEALQGKGIALLAEGKNDAAQAALRAAIARDATLWRAWNALGLSYDHKQDWTAAAEAYGRAAAAAPSSAVPHNNWGVSLMAQKRYPEAADHFARAVALDPDSEPSRTNLRLALAFQGKYAQAMAGVEQEDVPTLLNNIGYVAMVRGEKDRAKAYFLRSMELSPTYNEHASKNLQALEGRQTDAVY